ncbi:MAG TPA: S9 family peptidase [Candidatus Acidoferrales bacterium]|nr:S9 family peptidase [Candidatus Acidoferrales bacterium]
MSVLANPVTTLYAARKGPRPMTAEDLWRLPRVGTPAPSPDGRFAIVPVTTYDLEKNESRTRLWRVALDGAHEPVALSSPDVSAGEPRVSPDGASLAFTRKDAGGRAQLMLMPLGGGEARKLTDLPLGVYDPRWRPDGSGLVFVAPVIAGHASPEATAAELERRRNDPVKAHVTEERLYRFWDTWLTTGEVPHLFAIDLASGATRDLMPESRLWFDWMDPSGQYDLSPDGREIALAGISFDPERSLVVTRIYTLPAAGGELACRTPDHPADDLRPRYAPDGSAIVYGMTQDPLFYADRVRLMRWDRATNAHTEWLAGWDRTPTAWDFAADGTLVFAAEEHARVKLFAWRGEGTPRALTSDGSVGGVTPLGAPSGPGRVLFTHQSIGAPGELEVCTLEGGGRTRLTHFCDGVAAGFSTGEVRELSIEGANGEPVQMFVVLPPGYEPGKRYPLVHVVHGGPHGISADQFHGRWNAQLFAAPGYVAALVNFQGSTSWGQDFAKRIQGEWAARPFEDVMKATDALVAAGLVDEQRMAVAGGSYGGYMMTWIAGHTDRFRCIVNHAGVSDLMGQYASDVTQGRGRATGGEAWEGLERQDRWSPVRFASGMTTPMLVIHGERDYRVPVGQGLLIYGLLKAKGVPARLVYYPDENHWILKPRNSLLWYDEVHRWLARWLNA